MIFGLPPKRAGMGLRVRLSESQNHRCAFCATDITPYSEGEDETCTVKIDRDEARSYLNCVVVCRKCAGASANSPSLMTYYEVTRGAAKPSRPQRAHDPEMISHILALVAELAPPECDVSAIKVNHGFGFAPRAKAEQIARNLIHTEVTRDKAVSNRNSTPKPGYKRCFLESQNHRCCYCGHRMETLVRCHPRYATWEHVVALRNGGTDALDNLVLACATCNHTRDHLDLSAEDFYAWVQVNRNAIEGKVTARLRQLQRRKRFAVATLYQSDLDAVMERFPRASVSTLGSNSMLLVI